MEVVGGTERDRDNMDEQGATEERCGNCNALVPEDDGYENGRGDLLCTECFVDQWGPSTEELAMGYGAEHAGVGATSIGNSPIWSGSDLGGLT